MARPTSYKHSSEYYVKSYNEYREYFSKGIGKRNKKVYLRKNQRELTFEEYVERMDELKNAGIKTSLAKSIYKSQGRFSFKQAIAIADRINDKVMPVIKAKINSSKQQIKEYKKQGMTDESIFQILFPGNEYNLAPFYNKTARPSDIQTGTPFGRAIIKYLEEEYQKSWRAFFY